MFRGSIQDYTILTTIEVCVVDGKTRDSLIDSVADRLACYINDDDETYAIFTADVDKYLQLARKCGFATLKGDNYVSN